MKEKFIVKNREKKGNQNSRINRKKYQIKKKIKN